MPSEALGISRLDNVGVGYLKYPTPLVSYLEIPWRELHAPRNDMIHGNRKALVH